MVTELGNIWGVLKCSLERLLEHLDPGVGVSEFAFSANSHTIQHWSRNFTAVAATDKEDPFTTGYVFKWDAGPEYDWFTRDYHVKMLLRQVPIEGKSGHFEWDSTITIESKPVDASALDEDEDNYDPLEFTRPQTPFRVSFSPVLFGGVVSRPRDPADLLAFVTCDGDEVLQTMSGKFFEAHTAQKKGASSPIMDALRRALCDKDIRAMCSMRVITNYYCSSLAIEVSCAVADILAIPVSIAPIQQSATIEVVSQTRTFYANLTHLTAASSVIAACFKHPWFVESKKGHFDMTTFSADAVETFLRFCSHGTAGDIPAEILVELTELSHQYDVRGLLIICEVYLIRALVYCSNVRVLGELARVAVKLDLPLLLAAFDTCCGNDNGTGSAFGGRNRLPIGWGYWSSCRDLKSLDVGQLRCCRI